MLRLGAVAHPLSRQEGDNECLLTQFHDFVSVVREFAIKCRLRCVSASGATSGDSVKACAVSSRGFDSAARFCMF